METFESGKKRVYKETKEKLEAFYNDIDTLEHWGIIDYDARLKLKVILGELERELMEARFQKEAFDRKKNN